MAISILDLFASRMKKGFRLLAISRKNSGRGISLASADLHIISSHDSPSIVRSMSSLSSPHCPCGIPLGFGSLATADLHAVFSHASPEIVTIDFERGFDKVFPAISLFQEKACLDHTGEKSHEVV